jgi:DNA-binding NarL/FixJ family response regulator
VVAGHPVIRGIVRLACEGAGLTVEVEAAGLAEAEAALASADAPFTVCVLDLELPDGDGLRLLGRLGEEGRTVPTLVLSERRDGRTVLEVLRRGAAGYLSKPDGLRRVGWGVRRILAGGAAVEPDLERAAIEELGRTARQAREGARLQGRITRRERDVLALMSEGLTMQQIGRRLQISPRTVETHVRKLYRKLGVRTRVQAVSRAAGLGLLELR